MSAMLMEKEYGKSKSTSLTSLHPHLCQLLTMPRQTNEKKVAVLRKAFFPKPLPADLTDISSHNTANPGSGPAGVSIQDKIFLTWITSCYVRDLKYLKDNINIIHRANQPSPFPSPFPLFLGSSPFLSRFPYLLSLLLSVPRYVSELTRSKCNPNKTSSSTPKATSNSATLVYQETSWPPSPKPTWDANPTYPQNVYAGKQRF